MYHKSITPAKQLIITNDARPERAVIRINDSGAIVTRVKLAHPISSLHA